MAGKHRQRKTDGVNLVRLPPVGETDLLLVDFGDDTTHSITSQKVLEIIRKAKKEGHPVWVLIG